MITLKDGTKVYFTRGFRVHDYFVPARKSEDWDNFQVYMEFEGKYIANFIHRKRISYCKFILKGMHRRLLGQDS